MKTVTKERLKNMWVHPSFAKRFKSEAAMKGLKIVEYSKMLANEPESLDSQIKKKKGGFRFEI